MPKIVLSKQVWKNKHWGRGRQQTLPLCRSKTLHEQMTEGEDEVLCDKAYTRTSTFLFNSRHHWSISVSILSTSRSMVTLKMSSIGLVLPLSSLLGPRSGNNGWTKGRPPLTSSEQTQKSQRWLFQKLNQHIFSRLWYFSFQSIFYLFYLMQNNYNEALTKLLQAKRKKTCPWNGNIFFKIKYKNWTFF